MYFVLLEILYGWKDSHNTESIVRMMELNFNYWLLDCDKVDLRLESFFLWFEYKYSNTYCHVLVLLVNLLLFCTVCICRILELKASLSWNKTIQASLHSPFLNDLLIFLPEFYWKTAWGSRSVFIWFSWQWQFDWGTEDWSTTTNIQAYVIHGEEKDVGRRRYVCNKLESSL